MNESNELIALKNESTLENPGETLDIILVRLGGALAIFDASI